MTLSRVKELASELRRIAVPIGPMHSWWDIIFDLEAIASGKKPTLDKTSTWYIEYAERLLKRINRKEKK